MSILYTSTYLQRSPMPLILARSRFHMQSIKQRPKNMMLVNIFTGTIQAESQISRKL